MGFIETLIHLPTAEQWPLIKPLILLMQVFFVPFVGLLIVSAIISVAFRLAGRSEGLSRDMIDLGLRHPAAWLVFGLLPLVAMLCGQRGLGVGQLQGVCDPTNTHAPFDADRAGCQVVGSKCVTVK